MDKSPKRMKACQRGQRMAYRGKRRHARRAESKTGGGESIPSAGDSDENRRKSVCTLRFRGPKRLQCLRAVGPRPDSDDFRMRPYALPLKGKKPKRSNSQKRRIKCIRLLRCSPSPTLHRLFDFGGKAHNQCMRSAFGRISVMEVRRCPLKSEGRTSSTFPLSVRIHALQARSGPKLIADCFRPFSELFFIPWSSTRPPPA